MHRFETRRLSDPVHGTIGLSELEIRVLSCQAFQRLKHVKQLGLAYHVYPGADYSRFAHSVGVCHTTGRILAALIHRYPHKLKAEDIEYYRLAALLHDVGHYPFSHTLEHVIRDFYSKSLFAGSTGEAANFFKHERVSKEVVLSDPEIAAVLKEHDAKRITAIFLREEPPPFSNLVSSDLDADRIDYLLRTAHHSGLPYGSVDLDYIISQMRVDGDDRVALTAKAVRAADHLLLSRFFDYQQVAFHKTVAGLEWCLSDVLKALLEGGHIRGSADQVSAGIKDGQWAQFDDQYVVSLMRRRRASFAPDVQQKADAVLMRRPPKMLCETEYIAARGPEGKKAFRLTRQFVKDRLQNLVNSTGIPAEYWHLWEKDGLVLTKVGSRVPISSAVRRDEEDDEAYEQSVRILDATGAKSRPIMELPHSLLRPLSDQALYAMRLYVLPPAGFDRSQLPSLTQAVREELKEVDWK